MSNADRRPLPAWYGVAVAITTIVVLGAIRGDVPVTTIAIILALYAVIRLTVGRS